MLGPLRQIAPRAVPQRVTTETKPERCPVCRGRGYFNCDCWPGDCICGVGDEECDACCGSGFADFDPGEDRE